MNRSSFHFPDWLKINQAVFTASEPTMVGTSGGLTSALMAALYRLCSPLEASVEYCFWNTGREADGTYDFLGKLAQRIPLRCFEVRKPLAYGAGPSEMRFEEVPFDRLNRTGKPFEIMLETLAEYRATVKGEPPVGPNPVQRVCTAYMKEKLSNHVATSFWGEEAWLAAVGLRADEPRRVAKMSARDTARKVMVAPLFQSGITKCMVDLFWQEQDFTLDIPPHQGNCTLCFLKDEADVADILAHEPDPDHNNWEWWKQLDDRFEIRGRGSAGYRQIESEIPMRFAIREALIQIQPLPRSADYDPRRYKLVLAQERKIIEEGRKRVPCSCESAELMTDEFVLDAQGCLF